MKKVSFIDGILIFSVVLSALSAVFLFHPDAISISNWAYDLLSCIKSLDISSFPEYTYKTHGLATNYSFLTNLINACLLSPLFIIDSLFKAGFSEYLYLEFYKIILFIITLFSAYEFYLFLPDLGFNKEEDLDKKKIAVILFLSSAVTALSVLGKGQVDIYSLLFLLLGGRFFIKERYIKAALLFGLSFVIKPFPILLIIQIFLLLISKEKFKAVIYGLVSLIPYLIDKFITRALMPEYSYYLSLTTKSFKEAFSVSRFEQLFSVSAGNILLFSGSILILSFFSYYIGMEGKTKKYHYFIFTTLSYFFLGAFASATNYWFVTIIPVLIIMGLDFKRIGDMFLLLLINQVSTTAFMRLSVNGLPSPVLNPVLKGSEGENLPFNLSGAPLPEILKSEYIIRFFSSVFVLTILLMIIEYLIVLKNKEKAKDTGDRAFFLSLFDKVLLLLNPLFILFYLIYQFL